MNRILAGLVTCVAVLLAGACGSGSFSLGSSAPPPSDMQVVAGDTSATVTWTMAPGVDYWIMLAPTASITSSNWSSFLGARSVIRAVSPQLVTGLLNGTTYAFTINGRQGNGAGGQGAASQAIVPRLAGGSWLAGSALGSGDLAGATYGSVGTAGTASAVSSFVAVGAGGKIYSSNDAKTWTAQNSSVSADLKCAVFGGAYLAAGAAGSIVTSADAITWAAVNSGTSSTLNGLATNNAGTYIAVGAGGSISTSSDSGSTWKAVSSGTTRDLYAIAYGSNGSSNVFIAVGAQGTVLSSADGLTWTSVAAPTTADLKGVSYAAVPTTVAGVVTSSTVTWVAVGNGGSVISSNDSASWALRSSGSSKDLSAVTFNTRFVALGDAGTLLTSDDGGLSWQAQLSPSSAKLSAITHSLYGYLAVGAAGTNLTAF